MKYFKNVKQCLTVAFILSMIATAQAQYTTTSQKEAAQIKNRILMVSLAEENVKAVAKLKKEPAELKEYRSNLEGENNILKFAIQNYWQLNSAVEFEPASKANALVKQNPGKYALIRFDTYTEMISVRTGRGHNDAPAGWRGSGSNLEYITSTRTMEAANQIAILNVLLDGKQAAKINLPNLYPSTGDAVYAVQQLQYVLQFMLASPKNKIHEAYTSEAERIAPELKNKTLLIPAYDVDKKLSAEEIKKLYPYPFKVVSFEELEQAIVDKKPQYAFVQLITMDLGKGNVNGIFISDTEDGRIYLFDFPKLAFASVQGIDIKTNQRIKEKQIKTFAEAVGN